MGPLNIHIRDVLITRPWQWPSPATNKQQVGAFPDVVGGKSILVHSRTGVRVWAREAPNRLATSTWFNTWPNGFPFNTFVCGNQPTIIRHLHVSRVVGGCGKFVHTCCNYTRNITWDIFGTVGIYFTTFSVKPRLAWMFHKSRASLPSLSLTLAKEDVPKVFINLLSN